MTTYFQEVLESSAMVSDKCYLKCVEYPVARSKIWWLEKDQNACNPKDWWNRDSRYCPEEDENVVCQVECITMQ